jgi:hypothetical protein
MVSVPGSDGDGSGEDDGMGCEIEGEEDHQGVGRSYANELWAFGSSSYCFQ